MKDVMEALKKNRNYLAAAALIFAVVFALLRATTNDVGMAWDEGNDIRMAKGAEEWFGLLGNAGARPFSRQTIERCWGYEWKQHPSVTRIYFAAARLLYGDTSESPPEFHKWKSYRMGSYMLLAGLAAALFLFGLKRFASPAAGAAAAAAFAFMPRMFGHGHIVETDLMLCAMWFAAAAAFLKGLESKWGSVAFGIVCGLLPAVKFTGLFAVVPFFIYGAIFERNKLLRNVLCAALLGPVVFYAVQPMYWHTPASSLAEYLRHFTSPAAYNTITTYYFGQYYPRSTPLSYPWVMTALSLPLPTLLLAAVGMISAAFVKKKPPADNKPVANDNFKYIIFVILNALFLLALFSPARVAKYDGERLLMPVFPFWALLAGAGLDFLVKRFRAPLRAISVAVFAAALFLITMQARPFYLCFYNSLVGGTAGADKRGLEVMYWGEAFTPEFAAAMNRSLPLGARLTTIGYFTGNFEYFQDMGLLRRDISIVDYGGGEADFLLAFNRRGVLDPFSSALFYKAPPIMGVQWKGIRMSGLYLLKPGLRFFEPH